MGSTRIKFRFSARSWSVVSCCSVLFSSMYKFLQSVTTERIVCNDVTDRSKKRVVVEMAVQVDVSVDLLNLKKITNFY